MNAFQIKKSVAVAFASASLLLPAAVWAQAATGAGAGSSSGMAAGAAGSTAPAAMGAGSRAAGAALHATDRRFVEQAAQSDLSEIATSKLAQQKGGSDKVKQYAQHMIDDHTKTSQQLMTMAQSKNMELPSAPNREQQRMMAKLEKASGDKFEREYMRGQVDSHQKAVSLFERQARNGRDPELKQFASTTLPSLREHLRMAKEGQSGGGMAGHHMDRNSTGTSASMNSGQGSGGASGASAGGASGR